MCFQDIQRGIIEINLQRVCQTAKYDSRVSVNEFAMNNHNYKLNLYYQEREINELNMVFSSIADQQQPVCFTQYSCAYVCMQVCVKVLLFICSVCWDVFRVKIIFLSFFSIRKLRQIIELCF